MLTAERRAPALAALPIAINGCATDDDGRHDMMQARQRVRQVAHLFAELFRCAAKCMGKHRQNQIVLARKAIVQRPTGQPGALQYGTNGQPFQPLLVEQIIGGGNDLLVAIVQFRDRVVGLRRPVHAHRSSLQ